MILEELTMPEMERPRLQEDETNYEGWFLNMCTFIGEFYLKYPHLELNPLLQYVMNAVAPPIPSPFSKIPN